MQRGLFEIPQMCLFAGSKYLNYKYRMPWSTFGAFYNHIKFIDWILDFITVIYGLYIPVKIFTYAISVT